MTISVKSPEFAAVCEAGAASAAIARWLNSEASSDTAVIMAKRTAWLTRFSLRCDMVLDLPEVTLFDGGAMLLWSPARQKPLPSTFLRSIPPINRAFARIDAVGRLTPSGGGCQRLNIFFVFNRPVRC